METGKQATIGIPKKPTASSSVTQSPPLSTQPQPPLTLPGQIAQQTIAEEDEEVDDDFRKKMEEKGEEIGEVTNEEYEKGGTGKEGLLGEVDEGILSEEDLPVSPATVSASDPREATAIETGASNGVTVQSALPPVQHGWLD
jgi:hypothetical protein